MKRLAILAALTLAACAKQQAPAKPAHSDAPPLPPYVMRDELPAGDRLAENRDGEALFSNRCGVCHLAGGMGTNLLTKQRLALGEPPENGLLANRQDLAAAYVVSVVRNGKMAMPRLSRVEVTDAELAAIADYLDKAQE